MLSIIYEEIIYKKHSSLVLHFVAFPLGPGIVFIIFTALVLVVYERGLFSQIVSPFFLCKISNFVFRCLLSNQSIGIHNQYHQGCLLRLSELYHLRLYLFRGEPSKYRNL